MHIEFASGTKGFAIFSRREESKDRHVCGGGGGMSEEETMEWEVNALVLGNARRADYHGEGVFLCLLGVVEAKIGGGVAEGVDKVARGREVCVLFLFYGGVRWYEMLCANILIRRIIELLYSGGLFIKGDAEIKCESRVHFISNM